MAQDPQALRPDSIRDSVRKDYGKVISSGCCGSSDSGCCSPGADPQTLSSMLGYTIADLELIPDGANLGLGCGNPVAIASLETGETVLDLGSGAGIDSFLAARAVGETGQVIGVDMTPGMVGRARHNAEKAGFDNVEFRIGEIEKLPVADNSVDVILSNCVINLSPEKQRVFDEAYRVLKAGGRLSISDVVTTAELPEEMREDMKLYSSCVSGASSIEELEGLLTAAGFTGITITPKDASREFLRDWAPGRHVEEYIVSAIIQASKAV